MHASYKPPPLHHTDVAQVFYFLWVNCLISFAFLLSTFFRSSRTAVVVAFLYTFATGLIGYLLLTQFIQSGHWWCAGLFCWLVRVGRLHC